MKALLIVTVAGIILASAIYGLSSLTTSQCNTTWSESGFESKFVGGSGCMVKVDGRWVPAGNVVVHAGK